MNSDQAIAQLNKQIPAADKLWVELAGRLQVDVLAHDPGNAGWLKADVLLGFGQAEPVAAAAARLAGQTARVSADLDALLAKPPVGRVVVLAEAGQANQVAQAAGKSSARLVVLTPAPCPGDGWVSATVAGADKQALAAALCEPGRRTWVQLTSLPAAGKPAPASAEAAQSLTVAPGLPSFAPRMAKLGTETAFDVLAQVHALRAQGKDIISFGLGEPDFDTPAHIKDRAKQAIEDNQTHYGPSQGQPGIRKEIAKYISRTRNINVTADHVAIGPGAKPIIFDVMMALVGEGDEVIYPNPGYPIYESVIDWIGATSVPVPLLEEKDWSMDVNQLARLITPRTRMIVLNSPQNPTGGVIPPADLKTIAQLAIKHNLWVLSDEVYCQIVFGAPFASIASEPGLAERTIIIDGFSKTYAMTGWRLGYGVMHPELAKRVARIETNIDSCTCSFTQLAGEAALTGTQEPSVKMAKEFERRAKYIVERLNDIQGVTCRPAGGAFYAFPNVTEACKKLGIASANELQKKLLHEAGVAVLPRTCFGRKNPGENQEYLRFSYATSMEIIAAGMDRMKAYIEKGQKVG